MPIHQAVNNKSNIYLTDLRFAFDEYLETTVWVRHGQLEYSDLNIRIFANFIVSNHILNFQPQTELLALWLASSESNCNRHITTFRSWPLRRKVTFSSIDESTSKFIEINGNPFYFYVIDWYRRHYDTQINEMTKITYKIDLPSPVRQTFEYLSTNHRFDSTNLWEHMVWQIYDSTSNIRIFVFDQMKMLFTAFHAIHASKGASLCDPVWFDRRTWKISRLDIDGSSRPRNLSHLLIGLPIRVGWE